MGEEADDDETQSAGCLMVQMREGRETHNHGEVVIPSGAGKIED